MAEDFSFVGKLIGAQGETFREAAPAVSTIHEIHSMDNNIVF